MTVEERIPLADSPIARAIPHLTEEQSKAKGRAAREKVPRNTQAVFDPGPERPDPIALLEDQAKTRVPELVPIRYGRMLVSPFTHFRGRGADDGVGPRHHAALRAGCPDLRRRPPLELRRLRVARTPARVRLQRLRRDASRAVGVGRQAAGRQRRRRERATEASPGTCGRMPSWASAGPTASRCA